MWELDHKDHKESSESEVVQLCPTLCDPVDYSLRGSSMEFSRQEYWSGLLFPSEHQRTDAFKLWCWRLLRVSCTARKSNQSIVREINPEYSLEGLMLKLKLQYFCHLMQLIGKDPDTGKDWRHEQNGATEDVMVGWHHWLNRHECEQTLGNGEGQGSLVCCGPWGRKESDMTDWLNNEALIGWHSLI